MSSWPIPTDLLLTAPTLFDLLGVDPNQDNASPGALGVTQGMVGVTPPSPGATPAFRDYLTQPPQDFLNSTGLGLGTSAAQPEPAARLCDVGTSQRKRKKQAKTVAGPSRDHVLLSADGKRFLDGFIDIFLNGYPAEYREGMKTALAGKVPQLWDIANQCRSDAHLTEQDRQHQQDLLLEGLFRGEPALTAYAANASSLRESLDLVYASEKSRIPMQETAYAAPSRGVTPALTGPPSTPALRQFSIVSDQSPVGQPATGVQIPISAGRGATLNGALPADMDSAIKQIAVLRKLYDQSADKADKAEQESRATAAENKALKLQLAEKELVVMSVKGQRDGALADVKTLQDKLDQANAALATAHATIAAIAQLSRS